MAKELFNKTNNIDNDKYFFSASIFLDETIERAWYFIRYPIYFKDALPKNFVNFKTKREGLPLCQGNEFSFYWVGIANSNVKCISIKENSLIKKLILEISLSIGIFYRKEYHLYKISNNNSTLVKIIISKIPNKEWNNSNFISFINLNPDIYSSILANFKQVLNTSKVYLFNTESFIIDKNYIDSWNIITDLNKLSELNPNIGTNFTYQDSQYRNGSFVKCFIPKIKKYIFLKVIKCDKKKKKNSWVYVLETFGAELNYINQEIRICTNKITENRTQISITHIFKQILPKDYLENFGKKKKEFMKELKKYMNNI